MKAKIEEGNEGEVLQLKIFEFPEINFDSLFEGGTGGVCGPKKAKLDCIFNYFKRLEKINRKGNSLPREPLISFERKVLVPEDGISWEKSKKQLLPLQVFEKGFIENSGCNFLHVDFANKWIGGGVL